MVKKSLIAAAVVMVAGAFVFGRDVFSYARTWGASVRDAVKREVPIEFQVQRAREMVEKLVPDIRDCMHVIAEQQVDVEHRRDELEQKQAGLEDQKRCILALKADLSTGKGVYQYASRTYTPHQVKQDLALRFERFKIAEDSLKRDEQILTAREKALRANEQKLDTLLAAKKDLEVQVEQLESRLKTIQASQAASNLQFDDTRLARAKKLIGELNRQLDIQVKILDTEGRFTDLIPIDGKPELNVENITQEIDIYFNGPQPDAAGKEQPSADQPTAQKPTAEAPTASVNPAATKAL